METQKDTLTRADVLDVCAVMLQRCRLSAADLAVHMGQPVPEQAGQGGAAPVQAGPSPRTRGQVSPRMAQALQLADAEGGVSVADIERVMVVRMQTAHGYLAGLCDLGMLTKVKVPGIRVQRYFARPAHALAWYEAQAPKAAADVAAGPGPARPVVAPVQAQAVAAPGPEPARAPTPVNAPVLVPVGMPIKSAARAPSKMPPRGLSKKAGPAALTSYTAGDSKVANPAVGPVSYGAGFKGIQRAAPAPDTRFSVRAGEALSGGFSTGSTGRPGINPLTNKPWGAPA